MKKIYRMKDLDCANCAAKMERAIQRIDGVIFAEVSFMAQRLTLEMDDNKGPAILEQVKQCVTKVEPDCQVLGI